MRISRLESNVRAIFLMTSLEQYGKARASTLAKATGYSGAWVRQALTKLEALGVVQRDGPLWHPTGKRSWPWDKFVVGKTYNGTVKDLERVNRTRVRLKR